MLETIAFGAKVAGTLIEGFGLKKQADKDARRAIKKIESAGKNQLDVMHRKYDRLVGQITSGYGATNIRLSSGTPQAVLKDEASNFNLQKERVNQLVDEAIQEEMVMRRRRRDSANVGMFTDIASTFATTDFGKISGQISNVAPKPFRYTPGLEGFRDTFTFKSGIDFDSPMSPDYTRFNY
jgi:hypothetical protein